jgi:hypothetical protein
MIDSRFEDNFYNFVDSVYGPIEKITFQALRGNFLTNFLSAALCWHQSVHYVIRVNQLPVPVARL